MIARAREALARRRHRKLLSSMAGPQLLRAFADSYADPFFVEIGANDGRSFDHLRPLIRSRNWKGILVEPVPYVFARLQDNYAGVENVILENAAISPASGTLPFHHLREVAGPERDRLPDFYDALGSFSIDAVLAHEPQIPDVRDRVITTSVESLTFETLLDRHHVERVDLVLIDTEGHDYEIIKSIDLTRHRPRLLIYEHFHLTRENREACESLVRSHGYETMQEGFDTFCLDRADAADQLSRRWLSVTPAVPGVSKENEEV